MGRVLVPTDGSPQAMAALEFALGREPGTITVLHVIDPVGAAYSVEGSGPLGGERWYEHARERADELLEEARERAEGGGVEVTTATAVDRPAGAIVEYAETHDVDEIVMGSHGRSGVSRVLLGSVAETVVRRAPVPVTVVR